MSDEIIKLEAPKHAAHVSWRGEEFPVKDGAVLIHKEALVDLEAHGFVLPKTRKGKNADASN